MAPLKANDKISDWCFLMAKLEIVDDCFAPDRYLRIKYSGPDPWGIAGFLDGNLKNFFHVSSSKVNNYRINWDISGDPITFYSRWWVRKKMGRFQMMRILFKLVGDKGKTRNEGNFSLTYHARVVYSLKGFGPFLKPFWNLYCYLFFNRVRRKNIEQCRNYMLTYRNMIKEHFNIAATDIPTSRGFG